MKIRLQIELVPWYADFSNFFVSDIILENLSFHQKKFVHDDTGYFWDEPYLFRRCANNIIRRIITEVDIEGILKASHTSPIGGHHAGSHTTRKVLQSCYYWMTLYKDVYEFVKKYDQC